MPFKMKLKPFKSETLTPESSPLKVPDQSDDADLTIDQSDVNLTMDDLGIYITNFLLLYFDKQAKKYTNHLFKIYRNSKIHSNYNRYFCLFTKNTYNFF